MGPSPLPETPWQEVQCVEYKASPVAMDSLFGGIGFARKVCVETGNLRYKIPKASINKARGVPIPKRSAG
jgi:hypothetical protein